MVGRLNLNGGTLNLEEGTLTLYEGTHPPYNLSTGYSTICPPLATLLDFHLYLDQSLTLLTQLAHVSVIKGSEPCIFDLDPDLAW